MSISAIKKCFPEGKFKAFTMSYDDGVIQDRRLVGILDQYSVKGTFNLNSGRLGTSHSSIRYGKTFERNIIPAAEVMSLYRNHEVAVHSLNHPRMETLAKGMVLYETIEDRNNLEKLVGYPVRGMAYPFGTYNTLVKDMLEAAGIEYSRTTNDHYTFKLPKDFLALDPTIRHKDPRLMELAVSFRDDTFNDPALFYVWGHAYEFDDDNNWEVAEKLCETISNRSDIWYATNIEIVDYLKAYDQLKYSVDGSCVYNPTALDIWVKIGKNILEIPSGKIVEIV